MAALPRRSASRARAAPTMMATATTKAAVDVDAALIEKGEKLKAGLEDAKPDTDRL